MSTLVYVSLQIQIKYARKVNVSGCYFRPEVRRRWGTGKFLMDTKGLLVARILAIMLDEVSLDLFLK